MSEAPQAPQSCASESKSSTADKENTHENVGCQLMPGGKVGSLPLTSRGRTTFNGGDQAQDTAEQASIDNESLAKNTGSLSIGNVTKEGVRVLVRIRPLPPQVAAAAQEHRQRQEYDKDKRVYAHTGMHGRIMVSSESDSERERLGFFDFDGVCDESCSNDDVWQDVGAIAISHFLQGTDSSIFSFGPTGSGKSWTMQGDPSQGSRMMQNAEYSSCHHENNKVQTKHGEDLPLNRIVVIIYHNQGIRLASRFLVRRHSEDVHITHTIMRSKSYVYTCVKVTAVMCLHMCKSDGRHTPEHKNKCTRARALTHARACARRHTHILTPTSTPLPTPTPITTLQSQYKHTYAHPAIYLPIHSNTHTHAHTGIVTHTHWHTHTCKHTHTHTVCDLGLGTGFGWLVQQSFFMHRKSTCCQQYLLKWQCGCTAVGVQLQCSRSVQRHVH